ncbi:unnamed protein product [Paramecium sonneborni]|uniref:WD domain, G-beta repeat protein n=1 Tax=Paramecium sonneborni TaxID=65129 RepID=A0A8S1RJ28_9CILI|nr:unnamed protein product [Paramecium sonneborni]
MNQIPISCSIPNHNEMISFACFNESCSESRLGCFQCIQKNLHIAHQEDLRQIPYVFNILSDTSNECNELINLLNLLNGKINRIFNQLKENLRFQYSITNEQWQKMNIKQMNETICKLINFSKDKQKLIKLASENTEALLQSFKTQIEELIKCPEDDKFRIQPFQYQVVNSIKENDKCYSICFNKDSSIIIAGYMYGSIKVFDFKQGQMNLKQTLYEHKSHVGCLQFMNKQHSFISGSNDNSIIIWKIDNLNLWQIQQKLIGHKDYILCLLLNTNEDLIISGSDDKSIKFWSKEKSWQCSQTLESHQNSIRSISLNNSQTQLISCAYDENQIIISQQNQKKEWIIVQKINQKGHRLCFINDELFVVQPVLSQKIYFYELNKSTNLFNKIKELEVQNGKDCYPYFPQQFIKKKQILLSKNGHHVNVIRINSTEEFQLEQFINFGTNSLFGRLTDDGEFMVSWDDKIKQLQIFQYQESQSL